MQADHRSLLEISKKRFGLKFLIWFLEFSNHSFRVQRLNQVNGKIPFLNKFCSNPSHFRSVHPPPTHQNRVTVHRPASDHIAKIDSIHSGGIKA